MASPPRPSVSSRTGRITTGLLGWVFVVLLTGGWWLWLRPEPLGGATTFVTVTGVSMQPDVRTGDLAVMRKHDRYEIGDVVAFRAPIGEPEQRPLVIHRIVGGDAASGFRLRGDNNDYNDPWPIRSAEISGELWWHAPEAGKVAKKMSDPLLATSVFAASTAFAVVVGSRARGHSPTPSPGGDA